MSVITGSLVFKGLTGGLTSEKSVLNIVPTELEAESRNIEILRDSSLRPRRGADFVGLSASAAFMHTHRTGTAAAELAQESMTGVFAPFKTSSGALLDLDIEFQNLSFKAYTHTLLKDYNAPYQTITPTITTDITALQIPYTVILKFAKNRVFFAGKHIKPGYIYLKADNTTLGIRYISIHIRDFNVATTASSRVTYSGKFYECVFAHTSAATDVTNFDAYGELVFNKYWVELNNQDIPVVPPAVWSGASVSYSTNVSQVVNKHAAATATNPYCVDFYDERLWLATEDRVYYSQVILDVDNVKSTATGTVEFGLMMSYADPFSTTDADPAPTDGGEIPIASGKIWQILSVEDSMFVGTSKAVQEIRGISSRFSSTSYKISDVINEGVNGVANMAIADNKMYVATTSNIWASIQQQRVIQGSTTVFGKVGNSKIKTYYQDIAKINKGTAYMIYSPLKEKIYYFHNNGISPFDTTHRTVLGQIGYAKNIMVIDVSAPGIEAETQEQQSLRNHIEIWEYADTAHRGDVYIASAYLSDPISAAKSAVVVGVQNQVIAGAGNRVMMSSASGVDIGGDEIILLLMQRTPSGGNVVLTVSVGVLESESLRDWDSSAEHRKDYTAVAHLGTQTFENFLDSKTVTYATFIFEKQRAGLCSCLFRSSFNFAKPTALGESTGKTSGLTEIYKDVKKVAHGSIDLSNYKATWYKHKVRGRGVAFQPTLQNTPGKDFRLYGWGQLAQVKRRQ